ncbi:hypothetical protein MSAN_01033900 [Mycena sanguinolenta]|uniref:F-box domain-containing protein n=1 Tax=Mycena sanguinolenta TaxID=230812 RepID=A0A8H7D9L0_9AGAR|nr:hypothetical protein MSAN_01033900 [Mycena sanguinolenta]
MSLLDSPFTDRLNTNYIPSDPEILQIRALLVDPMEEVARIDAQIAEMELTLTQLRERRALLQMPINAHKALISPMRLVPQDILQEIFLSCLPQQHNAPIDFDEAPLLLGRICRRWRSVAYSTPILWSSIHIPPLDPSTPPNVLLGLERLVAEWFERSATCPLSVSFVDSVIRGDSALGTHSLILQLVAVFPRLRCLELSGNAKLLRPLLQLGPEDAPLLKSIRIKTPKDQTPSTNILQIPTLRDVALTMSVLDPLSLPLPWSLLTSLRICPLRGDLGLDFSGALTVLRRCPNIKLCEVRISKPSLPSDAMGLPSIDLPQLHSLAFTGSGFHFNKWSSGLVAPNLRYLEMGDVLFDNAVNAPTCSNFYNPSRRSPISDCRQPHILLRPVSLDDEFMALFGPPHNLCPMLTHLTLLAEASGFSDAAALAFIKTRMAMPTPLQRFEAQFSRQMEFDIMPELQSFIANGLELVVQYAAAAPWKFKPRKGLNNLWSFQNPI